MIDMDTRRLFLGELMAGGGLAALLASQASGQTPQIPEGAVDSSQYWRDYYGDATRRGAAPDSDLRVLYFNKDDRKGLRYLDSLHPSELLDHAGDVTLDVSMSHFQPGTDDSKIIRQFDSAQLRIECIQTKPFMDILAPATWIAMAALYPNSSGKLPSLQTLGFEQPNLMSGSNKVILPGGSGKFSVNVSSMAKESSLHMLLRQGIKVAGIASPLIGFPAMSLPAAAVFAEIYSVLELHASFIMKSPKIDAYATQTAAREPSLPANAMPIATGDYIFVPRRHTDKLAEKLSKLDVNSGYLVDRTLGTSDPVDVRADKSIPEVTYLSLKINVNKIDLGIPSISSPGSGGAGGGGAAAGTTPKPAAGKTTPKKP